MDWRAALRKRVVNGVIRGGGILGGGWRIPTMMGGSGGKCRNGTGGKEGGVGGAVARPGEWGASDRVGAGLQPGWSQAAMGGARGRRGKRSRRAGSRDGIRTGRGRGWEREEGARDLGRRMGRSPG